MNQLITINILVKNNAEYIEKCLDSFLNLNCKIVVGDLGCNDETISICQRYQADIKKISLNNDLSQVKNLLTDQSKTPWILWLDPWEYLIDGEHLFKSSLLSKNQAYKVKVVKSNVITTSLRFWHKSCPVSFKYPVYETAFGKAEHCDIFLGQDNYQYEFKNTLLDHWKKTQPLAVQPLYYSALNNLENKNWDAFIHLSNLYLHKEKADFKSLVMINYYLSFVYCYVKKQYDNALRHIQFCIAYFPTMSEFWCLLGDIFYSTNNFSKAKSFYENAIILGSKRLKNDDMPYEIVKYKKYPTEMIESCTKILRETKIYAGKSIN